MFRLRKLQEGIVRQERQQAERRKDRCHQSQLNDLRGTFANNLFNDVKPSFVTANRVYYLLSVFVALLLSVFFLRGFVSLIPAFPSFLQVLSMQ